MCSLIISDVLLKQVDESIFWEKAGHSKTLEIVLENGETIIYEERALKQLLKRSLSKSDLIEKYSIQLRDRTELTFTVLEEKNGLDFSEEELVETKANLLLCGQFFEGMLRSTMKESLSKVIQFDEKKHFDSFKGILQEVKTGRRNLSDEIYCEGCQFFNYAKWWNLPCPAFGPVEWYQYFGKTLLSVPSIPKKFLARLEEPCPYFSGKKVKETHVLALVPKDMSILEMLNHALKPIEGFSLKETSYHINGALRGKYGYKKAPCSYWVIMVKNLIPKSYGHDYLVQLCMANCVEGYYAPSLLEAMICNCAEYVRNGRPLFQIEDNGKVNWTCVRDKPISSNMVFGSSSQGFRIEFDNRDNYRGIAPVWTQLLS